MPRGVPKAGVRKTQAYLQRTGGGLIVPGMNSPLTANSIPDDDSGETDEQIDKRIRERFEIMEDLIEATIEGDSRALIISGPPGLGKSYTVEQMLAELDDDRFDIIKGFSRATGIYQSLYAKKNAGQVITFDDCDSIFFDDVGLNLLKAACDTTENRRLHWRAETKMRDDNDDPLPTMFDYDGSVIFITNYDFDRMIAQGHKLAEHLAALVSRAHYIDLTVKNKRDYVIRIKQVIADGMFDGRLNQSQVEEVVEYIETHMHVLRELSLRMAIKIASMMKMHPGKWEKICDYTCCIQR